MLRSVLLKSLRDVRRSFAWWSLGIVGLVAMIVAVYPSVRDNPGLNKLVQDYPEALKSFIAFGGVVDYVSPAGYLGSELFSLMVPLVFLLALVGRGASTLAGEEESGTLDLLLAGGILLLLAIDMILPRLGRANAALTVLILAGVLGASFVFDTRGSAMMTTSSGETSGCPSAPLAICGRADTIGTSLFSTALTVSAVAPLRSTMRSEASMLPCTEPATSTSFAFMLADAFPLGPTVRRPSRSTWPSSSPFSCRVSRLVISPLIFIVSPISVPSMNSPFFPMSGHRTTPTVTLLILA